jgi:hypothetical protein
VPVPRVPPAPRRVRLLRHGWRIGDPTKRAQSEGARTKAKERGRACVWRGEEPVECGVGVRVRGPLYGAGPGEGSRMATAGARRGISCSELGVGQGLKTWLVFF